MLTSTAFITLVAILGVLTMEVKSKGQRLHDLSDDENSGSYDDSTQSDYQTYDGSSGVGFPTETSKAPIS